MLNSCRNSQQSKNSQHINQKLQKYNNLKEEFIRIWQLKISTYSRYYSK
jgi:hypothetical protein